MAGGVLYSTEMFNDLHFEIIDMGQTLDTSKRIERGEEVLPAFISMNHNVPNKQGLSRCTSDGLLISRTKENRSATTYSISDEQNHVCDLENIEHKNISSHAESKQLAVKRELVFLEDEPLCAGETKGDVAAIEISHSQTKVQENNVEEADIVHGSMSWAEKKKQFSLMKQHQSEDSFNSEMSSQSRQNVSDYLYARECDAEAILEKLGFGYDRSMNIPERFWYSAPNTNIAVSRDVVMETDDEVFDCTGSSLASFESSWSDSSAGRIPSRFASSLSLLSSLSGVSEPNDIEDHHQSVIPYIIEPESTEQEDSFDLMRHLRLNRSYRNNKGLLEPVTEEQEVSSTGSGSARTPVNAQQDSFDSVGNTSTATKILRKLESEESTSKTLRSDSIPENNTSFEGCDSKEKIIMDNVNLSKDEQSICTNSLSLPHPKHLRRVGLPQDSFELEEIMTSEENLDKIGEKRTPNSYETTRTSHIRRQNSDESSGFEDDSAYSLKKRSPNNNSFLTNSSKEISSEQTKVKNNDQEIADKDKKKHFSCYTTIFSSKF